MCLPISLLITLLYKETNVIQEAIYDFLLFAIIINQFVELTGHILASLSTFTHLKNFIVVDCFV